MAASFRVLRLAMRENPVFACPELNLKEATDGMGFPRRPLHAVPHNLAASILNSLCLKLSMKQSVVLPLNVMKLCSYN